MAKVVDVSTEEGKIPTLRELQLNPWTSSAPKQDGEPEEDSGHLSVASLEAWVGAGLDRQQKSIEQLISGAGGGLRTVANTLRFYDDAVAALGAAGSQVSLLDSVYPEKEVRDKARELTQRVAAAGTALSLNHEVFRALEAMDLSDADPATRHYVSQTLLNYRLAGVDKDEPTRQHLRELSDRATELSLAFSNNVQENVNRIEVRDLSELDGLPADYIKNHPPNADGSYYAYHRLSGHAAGNDVRP